MGGLGQARLPLVAVKAHEVIEAGLQGALHRQQRRALHLAPQATGNPAAAHLGAFILQPDRLRLAQGPKGRGQQVFEVLAAGLFGLAQPTETAAPVVGQPLEVDHGHPPRLQFQKQLGFAAAGAAPEQAQGPGLLKQV